MSTSDPGLTGSLPVAATEVLPSEDTGGTRGRERTRARLLHAAYEVFAEEGLDGASVEAICERAGFTRGAFYSNFTSKDELFLELARAVADRKLEAVGIRVDELRSRHDDSTPTPTPTEIVRHVLDGTIEDRFGVVLMGEIRLRAMRDDATARAYREWEESLIDRVQRIIELLATSYGFRLRMPARDFARLVLGVWETALVSAVIDRLDYDGLRELAASRAQQLALSLVDPAGARTAEGRDQT